MRNFQPVELYKIFNFIKELPVENKIPDPCLALKNKDIKHPETRYTSRSVFPVLLYSHSLKH